MLRDMFDIFGGSTVKGTGYQTYFAEMSQSSVYNTSVASASNQLVAGCGTITCIYRLLGYAICVNIDVGICARIIS